MESSRRDILLAGAAVAGAVTALPLAARGKESKGCSCSESDGSKPLKAFTSPGNKGFYGKDGAFSQDGAKTAYYDMMRSFGYPIQKRIKGDEFWVCDFVQRDYEKLGMGGIFWINEVGTFGDMGAKAYKGDFKDKRFGYLGHEIYLLPGQMLPEHSHTGGNEDIGPKMEAWHIRYGSVDFFGEYKGEGNETPISGMPKDEQPWGYGEKWFKSKYVAERKAGDIYVLKDPESWHFQRAGKYGAIVTEYATYHNHVQFSKPGMDFACSEAK
jgi:D-lyxose ketol-isomerase